ncbi:MAG: glycosyltransferase family 2 protein, partial [Muribaculaceae bacterium]
MTITASIVTYKTDPEELGICIDSLIGNGIDHIIISDNSPTDALRTFCAEHEQLEYIFNNSNAGYAAGHNIAIKRALAINTTYHLVINSDVYFENGVIEKIIHYMQTNSNVAQLQPKIVYPDGSLQMSARLLPTPADLILRRFMPPKMAKASNQKYTLSFWNHDCPANIPYHQGSFMLFRASAFEKVGLFDERFFMYPEDIDITRRMHKHFITIYWPLVTVTHVHKAESYRSFKMLVIHIVNMIRYFNKWGWVFDAERTEWNKQLLKELGYGKL